MDAAAHGVTLLHARCCFAESHLEGAPRVTFRALPFLWKAVRMRAIMTNAVTEVAAASPDDALDHFESLLAFETDCWDVHEAVQSPEPGFVLLDVRSPELFVAGHVPGAVNLPHRRINERNLACFELDALFVVYCAGPHCNGADKAAARIARLGRPVKKMIGGVEGWKDEGFELASGGAAV